MAGRGREGEKEVSVRKRMEEREIRDFTNGEKSRKA